jgi:CubicO group peptidase (beta-lactamase class C family)
MSHSAGLRASTWPWGGDQPWHPFEPTAWSQLVAMFPYTELLFAPGTQYRYSNPGVILLGRIIEALSGDDYEIYITKNILMPLEMHRTFFDRAPYHLRDRRSHSYVRTDAGLEEMRFDFDTGITVSNGGLNAPLTDMVRYLGFLIGDPSRSVYEGVLRRASLEEMWTPVIRANDGEGGSGSDVQAALSFFVEQHRGVDVIGHSGNQNGFLSHLYLHRPSRSGYVVAFNTEVSSTKRSRPRITRDVDDAVRDRVLEALVAKP